MGCGQLQSLLSVRYTFDECESKRRDDVMESKGDMIQKYRCQWRVAWDATKKTQDQRSRKFSLLRPTCQVHVKEVVREIGGV